MNGSPINSLISNPISSAIPINHLAPANSFRPINNNLVNNNNNAIPIGNSEPLNSNAISSSVVSVSQPINSVNSNSVNVINSISNSNSINSINNNLAITKPLPVARVRQNAGIVEFNTRPDRTHAARPRPERTHEHAISNSQAGRAGSRSSSRASRITTESSVSNEQPNSIEESNSQADNGSGFAGFGRRVRG